MCNEKLEKERFDRRGRRGRRSLKEQIEHIGKRVELIKKYFDNVENMTVEEIEKAEEYYREDLFALENKPKCGREKCNHVHSEERMKVFLKRIELTKKYLYQWNDLTLEEKLDQDEKYNEDIDKFIKTIGR